LKIWHNIGMNFNALSPSTKSIKSQQLATFGASEPFNDTKVIGVINTNNYSDAVTQVIAGVRSAGGVAKEFKLPELGTLNRTSPLTAHFAESFTALSERNLIALVKTNSLDGVVIISECDPTVLGLLLGCLRTNCPVFVVPQSETGFYKMLEGLDLVIKEFAPPILAAAFKTGFQVVERATKTHSPKRFLTKQALISHRACIASMKMAERLVLANDVKLGDDWFLSKEKGIVQVRGSACEDGGFVQIQDNYPVQFNNQAWVYRTLEDADRGIAQIKQGVVVLQNCEGVDVSIIADAIVEKGLEDKVALVTDGYCKPSKVLTVTHCRGSGFLFIQTGDALEIDLAKGRFNTGVLAKDMKAREKRGEIFTKELMF